MDQPTMQFVKREDVVPLCPHCNGQLNEVHTRSKGFPIWVGTSMIYFCSHCRKVLGFSQSRMG